MSEGDQRTEAALRGQLSRVDRSRDEVAKAWLVDVILGSELAEVEQLPISWVTGELPELISDILAAVGNGNSRPALGEEQLTKVANLAQLRAADAPPAKLTRELSQLQSVLLSTLRTELPSSDPQIFGEAAERLAAVFGSVTGAAVETFAVKADSRDDPVTGLQGTDRMRRRLEQMVAAMKRYGNPFALVELDVDGPGTRGGNGNGDPGHEAVLAVVATALRGSIRTVDEPFRLGEGELCVIAPNQTASDAAQMAHRLAELLGRLEKAGGLPVTISAGVVACPEHGDEPDDLLRRADTAMWRARATGQPVSIADLQDH